jgi:thiamine-monophosphate kinase
VKTLSQIGEARIIREIAKILKTQDPDVLCGIGDDAAVLQLGNKKILFTVDALLEAVHFDWSYSSPYLLGRKSLSVNLSDVAAMGGRPRWALVSLALPSRARMKTLMEFYRGLRDCGREFGVEIVGGDTDRSAEGRWKITVAVIGEAEKVLYRKGARVGDGIWVTGSLGRSALGFEILRRGLNRKKSFARWASPKILQSFIEAHLNPVPRVREGFRLAQSSCATSLIDVSDGLLLDLERICSASGVGARIEADSIPWAPQFYELCSRIRVSPLSLALSGGEDYELLFTAPPEKKEKLIKLLFEGLGPRPICIGEVVSAKKGIEVVDEKGKAVKTGKKGYHHF